MSETQTRFPDFYIWLVRKRTWARYQPDRISCFLVRRRIERSESITIKLNVRAGFFANMSALVELMAHCERHRCSPFVRLTGSTYRRSRGDDWLETYFERLPGAPSPSRFALSVRNARRVIGDQQVQSLSIADAHSIVTRHLRPNDDIVAAVDRLYEESVRDGSTTLGVHFRGTDKKYEAPLAEHEVVLSEIVRLLDEDPSLDSILLASDDSSFIAFIENAALPVVIIKPPTTVFGDGVSPPHFVDGADKEAVGREALITCLSLARCSGVLRTSSYLSAWAKVFNPAIRTITLNRPYNTTTFPETELLEIEREPRDRFSGA